MMKKNDHLLTPVWKKESEVFCFEESPSATPSLERIFADFFALGKYYYYVLTLAESSITQPHENILEMHGLQNYPTQLKEIIDLIHPEDLSFVVEAEEKSYEKVKTLGVDNLLNVKTSYCFRMKTASGDYELFHHQAIHTQQSQDGRLLQAVNIHTNIHHLTSINPYTVVISGINSRNDFHQIPVYQELKKIPDFKLTNREKQIIGYIVTGLSGTEISSLLHLSEHTVRSHRKNILEKMGARNSKELVRIAIEQGIL